MPGHTQATLEPAERRRWQALIDGVTDAWIKETPNGAAILAGYRKAVGDIRAGK
jgi:hypothetical protein